MTLMAPASLAVTSGESTNSPRNANPTVCLSGSGLNSCSAAHWQRRHHSARESCSAL